MNAVPEIDGVYNCYLDPVSARQLFADPDFKQLFQGATSANQVFRQGMVNEFLGLRFVSTTEAFVQAHPSLVGLSVRRPIICGQGALIEGDFAGMSDPDIAPKDALVAMVNGIAMVTRHPIDRLQQIIAQSWVLDRRVLRTFRHYDQPHDNSDSDQCGLQTCGDDRAYWIVNHASPARLGRCNDHAGPPLANQEGAYT